MAITMYVNDDPTASGGNADFMSGLGLAFLALAIYVYWPLVRGHKRVVEPSGTLVGDREGTPMSEAAIVDLYWLPLGAGGHYSAAERKHLRGLVAARLDSEPPRTCTTRHS